MVQKAVFLFCLMCLQASDSLVRQPMTASSQRLQRPQLRVSDGFRRTKKAIWLGLRLAGGANTTVDEPTAEVRKEDSAMEASNVTISNGTESNTTEAKRPPPTPEMIQQMNFRLWEAAKDGNEPLLDKSIKAGANVNAFCRGPDMWVNISVGELAGADEYSTGLNVHWMELNNYTALHLAAASGNAGIIDKLVEAGADINAECLQRVHPMPTAFSTQIPLFSMRSPLIFKCTPLRLARAANCGRCFFTSYQKAVDKLVGYGAADTDFHFPLNTVVLLMTFGLAWCGLRKWPWAWFSEWPLDWYQYPDLQKYLEPPQ